MSGAVPNLEARLHVATDCLQFIASHVIGPGGVSTKRLQRAAARAAAGDQHWREAIATPKRSNPPPTPACVLCGAPTETKADG